MYLKVQKLGLFLANQFNVEISGCELDMIYIKSYLGDIPLSLNEIWKPEQWSEFAQAFFGNIQNRKTHGSNIVNTGVKLCSSLDIPSFEFWPQIYEKLGANIFDFVFSNYRLYYKLDDVFICLTCKSQRSHKSPNAYSSRSFENYSQTSNGLLGSYGDYRILKEKLLYRSTLKKWPKNSILNNPTITIKDLINQICSIKEGVRSSNFFLHGISTDPPPFVVKGLSKILTDHKKQAYFKTYSKFDFESVAGELNRNKVLLCIKHIVMEYVPEELLGNRTDLFRFANFLRMILKRNINQVATVNEAIMYIYPGGCEHLLFRARTIDWLIHDYIFPIIKMFFYFNLSPKYDMIVYSARYWFNKENRMFKSLIKKKTLLSCEQNPGENCVDNSLRFLPKSDGTTFRLLIRNSNKYRRAFMKNANIFINQLTAKIKKRAGLSIKQDLHKLWLQFHNTSVENDYTRFYYLKTDIKDAYGSVLPDLLMDILDKEMNLIEEDFLEVLTFNLTGKKFQKSCLQFKCLPLTLSRGFVYEDPGLSETISKKHMRDVIFDHINSVKVRLKNRLGLYRLVQGLPQGGQLSAGLCELYYTALDIEYLLEFQRNGDFFVRLVDDYLFVSASFERAKRFVNLMYGGFPRYNARMEKNKSITNVDSEDLYMIPFFGYLIDVRSHTIGIYAPYLINRKIISTMSFSKITKNLLFDRMKNTASLKLRPVLLEPTYNMEATLISNLIFSSCLMALKYRALVKLITNYYELSVEYMTECVETAIYFIAKNAVKASRELSFSCVRYLACRCFIQVLIGDNSNNAYDGVIKKLALISSRISRKFNDDNVKFRFNLNKYIPVILQSCY